MDEAEIEHLLDNFRNLVDDTGLLSADDADIYCTVDVGEALEGSSSVEEKNGDDGDGGEKVKKKTKKRRATLTVDGPNARKKAVSSNQLVLVGAGSRDTIITKRLICCRCNLPFLTPHENSQMTCGQCMYVSRFERLSQYDKPTVECVSYRDLMTSATAAIHEQNESLTKAQTIQIKIGQFMQAYCDWIRPIAEKGTCWHCGYALNGDCEMCAPIVATREGMKLFPATVKNALYGPRRGGAEFLMIQKCRPYRPVHTMCHEDLIHKGYVQGFVATKASLRSAIVRHFGGLDKVLYKEWTGKKLNFSIIWHNCAASLTMKRYLQQLGDGQWVEREPKEKKKDN